MNVSLRQIRIAYIAVFGTDMPDTLSFKAAGQQIFNKLGSKACKVLMDKVAVIDQNHTLKSPYVVIAAEVNGWELVQRDDVWMVLTGTGAILGEGGTAYEAYADAVATH